ncbi:1-acyl-sn-glycerol-3-phosphate acyltransferase [Aliikangiella marina]|uniref:1-acyl-sn-glycerol-3-phosphate acyltransferase n=1 Tax=Aliikangiella marina TaxID=1712262 RepID=A0A545TH81_9GAMM|nr:lysophospholipid acyltransferase family protein [Aliikangiella marina]TQV76558.1 1-acyl-sn-glycerol-3-phosphate acyltransferase [Aliikangiella marina]
MSGRRISKLHFYWILVMTGVYTFYHCIIVIAGSFLASKKRALVDKQLFNWSKHLLGLVKVRVNVIGLENMPQKGDRPIIVMCNHSSLYDIPISAVALNTSLRMLAKKELYRIPVFSAALRRGEFLSIDRQNREQSVKDLQIAKEKMLDGIILWVAPEGTRSRDGKVAPFKRGAFHVALDTGALIVPLAIKDIHKVQSGKDLTLYIDQDIEVEVCKPVDATQYSADERRKLVDTVRNKIIEALEHEKEAA